MNTNREFTPEALRQIAVRASQIQGHGPKSLFTTNRRVIRSRMLPTRQGSLRLFRLAGIDVFLHWSWFIVALYEIQTRGNQYSSTIWNVVEYLSLFLVVLMHEFGHALACRQVGGQANQIVLWPLGGVAYVAPPQLPGAVLWSIAAGPLVNVVLTPIFVVLYFGAGFSGLPAASPNMYALVQSITFINIFLLIFNLLPIYPLDGGQILRSLLWFAFGRARSLMISAVFGLVGVLALGTTAHSVAEHLARSIVRLHSPQLLARFGRSSGVIEVGSSGRRHPEFAMPIVQSGAAGR